jgi:serine/threonine protein kinase
LHVHHTGDFIDQRFRLIRPLGTRRGAEWWEAEREVDGRAVSLKLWRGGITGDADAEQQVVPQSRAAIRIGHRTAIQVLDAGVTPDGEAFLVTEPLRGEMLVDMIARLGALKPSEACWIAIELLGGLEAAHAAGMAHGSLAPSTVLLGRDHDGAVVVKILDFGLDATADPADDIRAAGSILREMLAGGPAPSPDLARIADQAITGRISNARQLADLLAPFAAPPTCPSLPVRDSLLPLLSPEARRSRAMARIEKAVLGDAQPEDRCEIPRPPRTPEHFASQHHPRLLTSAVSTGWTAGLLAAGITAGLLLGRLLHL